MVFYCPAGIQPIICIVSGRLVCVIMCSVPVPPMSGPTDEPTLDRQVQAWTTTRNREASKVTWQFTTADARIKLRHLYPQS